ncbi:serine hydrolase [Bradyrhizobium sp. 76]|jgi:CubicO group peptidase (beta-lactamase class C family)|uniref:serine hydrolase domain-containing protein n=2 Tax=Bradyrhizobium TaxID=374 RepID=UPI001FF8C511|nr:serine hydrolase [Bradyrhizobium sp. 76]
MAHPVSVWLTLRAQTSHIGDIRMTAIGRRALLMGGGALLMSAGPLTSAPFDWQSMTPSEAGFVPDLDARLDKLIAENRAWGLHGVFVTRAGKIVLERYFAGEDEAWGASLGRVAFGPDTLHDLRSVTKSVLGLLYGIALDLGKVPAPDQPLIAQFPDYADVATDARLKRLTVAHALTMTLGFDWNEDIPYQDPNNSEIQMESSPDRLRYVFSRPFISDPGARWIYGAAGTELIGNLLVKGVGQSLPDFARTRLFDPIGVGPTEWSKGFNGQPAPASGLRMTPRDLARVGQLVLNRGQWDGRQIVSSEWLAKAFQPYVPCDEQRQYGYFWYSGNFQYGHPPNRPITHWIGGFGYGGQRLFAMPDLDIVVAITCGNYADERQWMPPIRVVRDVVLAGLK